ncbi:Ptm1 protein [Martiniozyma asiatica (nom. inval.)]|nr:Ptm1 protein [Martiniozyma asiatica]
MLLPKLVFSTLATLGLAQKVLIHGNSADYCTGMYSKVDWGGPVEPFIKVELDYYAQANPDTGNATVAIVIFEYSDIDALGEYDPESGKIGYRCTSQMIDEGLCQSQDLYQFIVSDNYTFNAPVKKTILTELGTNDFSYHVTKTGYYCVAAYTPNFDDKKNEFKMIVNFHNAFGSLPASDIPMLPLYGLLSIVYAVCLGVYLFQVYLHRSELLILQKYLAGFFAFLTIENILTWSLYEARNNNIKFPMPAGIQFYIVFISMLNSFKVAFSFFLILIIALGYGVVYPKLSAKTMDKCKLVCAIQFMAMLAYTGVSYYTTTSQPTASISDASATANDGSINEDSWLMMLVTIPNILMFIVLYYVVLFNMRQTIKKLQENNQVVKLGMYRKLINLIGASVLVLFIGTVLSSVLILGDTVTASIESFWKFNTVVTYFWPSAVYFVIFLGVAIIWRPSDTSYLLAASTQIPQNEQMSDQFEQNVDLEQYGNEFEFDDLRSMDDNPFQDPDPKSTSEETEPPINPFDDPVGKAVEIGNNDDFVLDDEDDAPNTNEHIKK